MEKMVPGIKNLKLLSKVEMLIHTPPPRLVQLLENTWQL